MTEGNRELVEKIFLEAEFVRSLGIELVASAESWCETRLVAKMSSTLAVIAREETKI